MTIILNNKEYAYELLGIKNTHINKDNDTCMICREVPSELLHLSCNHFGCITCLANWYKDTDVKCPYCKKDILWDKCEKI